MRWNRPFLKNQRPAKPKFESGWGDEGCENRDVGFMSKEDFAVLFVVLVLDPWVPAWPLVLRLKVASHISMSNSVGLPQVSHLMDVSTWGQLVSKTKSAVVIYLKYTPKGLGKRISWFC